MAAGELGVRTDGHLGTVIPGGLFCFCAGCPSATRPASPSTKFDGSGNVPQSWPGPPVRPSTGLTETGYSKTLHDLRRDKPMIDWLKTSIPGIILLGVLWSVLTFLALGLAGLLAHRIVKPGARAVGGRAFVAFRTPL